MLLSPNVKGYPRSESRERKHKRGEGGDSGNP